MTEGLDGPRYPRFDVSVQIELADGEEAAGVRNLHHPRADELELAEVLHALSDPVRLEIVRLLADQTERPCSSVEAKVAKSTLSHHFKVLREAGITWTRANGTHRLVSLRTEDLEQRFPGLIGSVLNAAQAA